MYVVPPFNLNLCEANTERGMNVMANWEMLGVGQTAFPTGFGPGNRTDCPEDLTAIWCKKHAAWTVSLVCVFSSGGEVANMWILVDHQWIFHCSRCARSVPLLSGLALSQCEEVGRSWG